MQVGVAYSEPAQQVWLNIEVPEGSTVKDAIEVPEGSTVKDAIERSGVLKQFPHIDLAKQKVGVFSKVVKLDTALRAGDRVEIYRAITCDPQTVPRRDLGESADD